MTSNMIAKALSWSTILSTSLAACPTFFREVMYRSQRLDCHGLHGLRHIRKGSPSVNH